MTDTKSMFITGITSGIGSGILKSAASAGIHVTGLIRTEAQRALFDSAGAEKLDLTVCDLSDSAAVMKLAGTLDKYTYDYIVLNAGCSGTGDYHRLPDEDIYRILQTNLISNMILAKAFIGPAIKTKSKIVMISSLAARYPGYNSIPYATSKAGLSHFFISLRYEYPEIPMLCLEIGPVDTPFFEKNRIAVKTKKYFRSQEDVAQRIFDCIINRTGTQTLYFDWKFARKFAMIFEDLSAKIGRSVKETYIDSSMERKRRV